jgi:hypothetical protein
MPRVALLLADDVGLAKTIEAGLILNELRRIRRRTNLWTWLDMLTVAVSPEMGQAKTWKSPWWQLLDDTIRERMCTTHRDL